MHVEKLMSAEVRSCTADHPLSCAARAMWEADCGCVPVIEDNGRVIGMITDRDISMACYLNRAAPQDLRVGEFMSRHVLACHPNDRIQDATAMMRRAQVRRLPVVDEENRLVGMLSLADVATAADRAPDARQHSDGVPLDEVGKTLGAVGTPRQRAIALHS